MRSTQNVPKARLAAWLVLLVAIVGFVMVGLPHPRALAQSATPSDDAVNRIAHQLYCPVCENTPLDVCPTEACRQWRDLIRQQLSEGWSEARIMQYFVDQYGARVLAEPPRTGLNWLVYVLPPLIIVVGASLLLRTMRTWTRPAARGDTGPAGPKHTPSSTGSEPDAYVKRLEDELKRRN